MVAIETPEAEERVARTQKRTGICNQRILYSFTGGQENASILGERLAEPPKGTSQPGTKQGSSAEPLCPPSLPATSISATPAASQPVPFKVSEKPAEQRKPCPRRASDHRTPHPRRRCLETARIPPTSFPAAVCIGAH